MTVVHLYWPGARHPDGYVSGQFWTVRIGPRGRVRGYLGQFHRDRLDAMVYCSHWGYIVVREFRKRTG